jgi:hypothetical protein
MRLVMVVGNSMVGPPRPKASRSWVAVSIFASMLVTQPLESLLHCASAIWWRRGRIASRPPQREHRLVVTWVQAGVNLLATPKEGGRKRVWGWCNSSFQSRS